MAKTVEVSHATPAGICEAYGLQALPISALKWSETENFVE